MIRRWYNAPHRDFSPRRRPLLAQRYIIENTDIRPFSTAEFSARVQPANLSIETDESLWKQGYVPIAVIEIKHATRIRVSAGAVHFFDEHREGFELESKTFPHDADPTSDLLRVAADIGGDLVILSVSNKSLVDYLDLEGCELWDSYYPTLVDVIVSKGIAWRHEPS